ncbi:response regulator [Kingella kingae]|uniref:Chemotaxis response regulator CheY n=2 Tax=Kingella kingae TaxID=504 RepID=F5S7Q8_KINKI|nr:response regulator [Kingella kingae]EGK08730.1 chemotaxis response regulator CheY [Kingella kingae ATCC 23330]EIC14536.1 response regulator receiver domain-containing protein [Kingella kingae PYKK081]MBD3613831.1 response regulator [Kingella kingae]MBD3632082.1 response regulator [Kingella kingae]MBD3659391.1 response regulator [Kingella kingae]
MAYKLMIVDDSNVIRNRISRGTSRMDIEVVATATNGLEAVELFKKHRPDIVTMDLTMPKMDGLECIYELTDIDPNANILVISALSDKATGIKALQLGARGFICKPFTDEDLFEALEEMME